MIRQLRCLSSQFETVGSKDFNLFDNADNLDRQAYTTNDKRIDGAVIGKYFLRYVKSFQSLDSIVFPAEEAIIVFQITIAKRHEIKPSGLERICAVLPLNIK